MITPTHNRMVSKLLITAIIMFVSCPGLFPRLVLNEIQKGFEENTEGLGSPMRQLVIEGAGHFLMSYSNILLLSNMIEMEELDGIDYVDVQKVLNEAFVNMESARQTYWELNQLGDSTPYQPEVIEQLLLFDYNAFGKDKMLIPGILSEVKSYLSKGDVRGIFSRTLSETEKILDMLEAIKSKTDNMTIPENSQVWELNQTCTHTQLFGQYVAQIFHNI